MYLRLGVCLCGAYLYLHVCTQVMHVGVCVFVRVCVCVCNHRTILGVSPQESCTVFWRQGFSLAPEALELGWLACKPQKPSYLYLPSNKIAVGAVISGLLCRYKNRTQILIVSFSLLTEQSSLSCTFVSSYLWNQDFTTKNLFTFSLPFAFFTNRKASASIHAMILLSMISATGFKETFVMEFETPGKRPQT